MDSPTEHKFDIFDEVSESQVLGYIEGIPRDKSTNDIIPLNTPVYSCGRFRALPSQSHDVIVFGGPWMLHFSRKNKISPFTVEPRLRSF